MYCFIYQYSGPGGNKRMDPFQIVIAVCAVVLIVAVCVLSYKLWTLMTEAELVLRDTRRTGIPALEKLDHTLAQIDEMTTMLNQGAKDTREGVQRLTEDLRTMIEDVRNVTDNFSKRLTGSDNRLSLVLRALMEGWMAYKRYKTKSVAKKEE